MIYDYSYDKNNIYRIQTSQQPNNFELWWEEELSRKKEAIEELSIMAENQESLQLNFHGKMLNNYFFTSKEYPGIKFCLQADTPHLRLNRNAEYTMRLKEIRNQKVLIQCDEDSILDYEGMKRLHNLGDAIETKVINKADNEDVRFVFLLYKQLTLAIAYNHLVTDIDKLEIGMPLKVYITSFDDAKQRINVSQIYNKDRNKNVKLADEELKLERGDVREVIPVSFHKGRGVYVEYNDYNGFVSINNFDDTDDMLSTITLGKPIQCKLFNISAKGMLEWSIVGREVLHVDYEYERVKQLTENNTPLKCTVHKIENVRDKIYAKVDGMTISIFTERLAFDWECYNTGDEIEVFAIPPIDEKQYFIFSQIDFCLVNLKPADNSLGLTKGQVCEVIPCHINNQSLKIIVMYNGYKGAIYKPKHVANKKDYLDRIRLGQPVKCSFRHLDATNQTLVWEWMTEDLQQTETSTTETNSDSANSVMSVCEEIPVEMHRYSFEEIKAKFTVGCKVPMTIKYKDKNKKVVCLYFEDESGCFNATISFHELLCREHLYRPDDIVTVYIIGFDNETETIMLSQVKACLLENKVQTEAKETALMLLQTNEIYSVQVIGFTPTKNYIKVAFKDSVEGIIPKELFDDTWYSLPEIITIGQTLQCRYLGKGKKGTRWAPCEEWLRSVEASPNGLNLVERTRTPYSEKQQKLNLRFIERCNTLIGETQKILVGCYSSTSAVASLDFQGTPGYIPLNDAPTEIVENFKAIPSGEYIACQYKGIKGTAPNQKIVCTQLDPPQSQGEEVLFVVNYVENDMIIGRVGHMKAFIRVNEMNAIGSPERIFGSWLNMLPPGTVLRAIVKSLGDEGSDAMELTRIDASKPNALQGINKGDEVDVCVVAKHPAGIVFELSDYSLSYILANFVAQTLDEYQKLNTDSITRLMSWGHREKSAVWKLPETVAPKVFDESLAGTTKVRIIHHVDRRALAVTTEGYLVHLDGKALKGKYAHNSYSAFHNLMPLDKDKEYDADISISNNTLKAKLLRDTPDYTTPPRNKTLHGAVISTSTENGQINFVVDLGDWLGMVPLKDIAWRYTDELDAAIVNRQPIDFVVIGYIRKMKDMLLLSRLALDPINLDTETLYSGRTKSTDEESVEVLLENGYTVYVPYQEAINIPKLRSPYGDNSIKLDTVIKVKYTGYSVEQKRLYATCNID